MKKINSKRNRSKDNPYILNYDDERNTYVVEFKDNFMNTQFVDVSEEVYKALDKFELEDISQIHKYKKYIEHLDLSEEELQHRMANKPMELEDDVEKRILHKEIKNIINNLSDIQKRRIIKYYFDNKTFEEIANEENCTKRAVKFSIDIALEKIFKNFKN